MLSVWLPRLLLIFAIPFAVRKGGEPERLVAIVIAASLLCDVFNHMLFGDPTWFDVNPGHFVIDLWSLLVFGWVALKANRGWPLWVCAAQLIVVMAHFAKLFEVDEARLSYWVLTQVPDSVELVVLIMGTAAHVGRCQRIGRYAEWRLA